MSTFRFLVRLTRYQPRYFVMLAARSLSIGLIPQGIALTSRAIFDNITSEQAATVGFWSLAAILLALAVTRSLMIFGNIILSVRVEFTFATLLRKNVFDHILDQPGNNALPESTGEAVTRFREDVDYVNKYLQRIGFAFPLLVFGVIALYIMLGINTVITFYVFLPLAVIMVTVSAASRWLRRFRLDNREATGDVTSLLGEMFGSVEAIKVANAEGRMITEFKRLNSRRKTYTIRDTLLTQSLNSVFQNTVTIGTGLILLIAASAMRDGSFSIGDFALFVSYLYMVGWLNSEIGGVLAEYRQTGVSFDRLRGLIPSAAPGRLVQHQRAYLAGDLPDVPFSHQDGRPPPRPRRGRGPHLPLRRQWTGNREHLPPRPARLPHRRDRTNRLRQNHLAPRPAWPSAQRFRRGQVERRAGRRPCDVLRAPSLGLHVPGASSLQRTAQR